MPHLELPQIALRTVNHIPAMVAYWDKNQRCLFSNDAYREWFGKSPEQMLGMSLKDLLGPLYEKNLPYILEALRGEKQIFERRIPLPGGGFRDSIATYTPDIIGGEVQGFSAHVADVTILRARETELQRVISERDGALAEVRTLSGLLPICASCKRIRDHADEWQPIERYVGERTEASFTHGMCPECMGKFYPDIRQ
ncbi:MAG: PAS domain-containing protein [Acidobacteriota bacterium]|nr:PAS domain-containing protein [Acidobacteriota bacterium]